MGVTDASRPKRRPRYSGKNPRRFEEKYKELDPLNHPETIAKVLASGKTPAGTHRPICLAEVMEILSPKPGETVVDATVGYGGHALELLRRVLPGGRLIGFDTDPCELPKTEQRLRTGDIPVEAIKLIHSNFAGMARYLGALGISGVDMVLADLGCSSMQLDNPARGFSFKYDGPLDLRMNPHKGRPASALLQSLDESAIAALLRDNGDEPCAEQIAHSLFAMSATQPLLTTTALARAVRSALKSLPKQIQGDDADAPVRRVFQALRVAVNEEFTALETFLRFLPGCLNPGGRVAILTFHSGEDRRVKKAFQEGARAGLYSAVSRDITRPGPEEIGANPRSRSAKLRWAIKA
jgi:16S rRNA (cytosine1402-N4)-methyltransferase